MNKKERKASGNRNAIKYIRFIHKWTGLLIGLFLFISCFTGIFILIGKLAGSYAPIFTWMKGLHRNLFMDESGRTIIGIATLLLLVEIITGYWLWIKIAKGQIKVSRKNDSGWWKGFFRSLNWTFPNKTIGFHNASGFWSGIPLLIMAFTGLTWSFGWFGRFVFSLFDSGNSGGLFHTIAALHTGSFLGNWSRILWLIMTIFGATLPITGLMIYLKSLSKK